MGTPSDPVLTLADLDRWSFAGTALAVLGHPIRHSISPAMHNAALAELARDEGRFTTWRYFKFDLPPDDVSRALDRLHSCGFHGINLTVPHKTVAFDLVAGIDPAARRVGAVNTLLRIERGWHGFNTDGHGLAAALAESFGLRIEGARIILLGAGGAARGAAFECLEKKCAGLWIGNRTQARLDALLADLKEVHSTASVSGFNPASPPAQMPGGALVINATSAGLRPGDPAPIDLARLPCPSAVYDMIYNPQETALLRQARALGVPCANGLSMLAHQGAMSLEIWTGLPNIASRMAPVMMHAARRALGTV